MNTFELEYDITVIGGGPAGLAAAISSAKEGMRVLLVEKNGFLGGNMTLGLPLLGYLDSKGRRIVGGFPQEIVKRLHERNQCLGHRMCPKHNSVTNIDPVGIKILAIEMCKEANVDVLLHLEPITVFKNENSIEKIELYGKGNKVLVVSKIFIDATGDGDVAFLAGCSYESGDSTTNGLQPPTVMFTMEHVDTEAIFDHIEKYPNEMTYSASIDHRPGYDASYFRESPNHVFVGLSETFKKLRTEGRLPVDRNTLIYIKSLKKDEVYINTTRLLNTDATNIFDLTKAEMEGTLQANALAEILRESVPGFENSFISSIAPNLGVRETRRFKGIDTLCEEDILQGTIDDRTICLGGYPIDIHSGKDRSTIFKRIDEPFGIPYGSLVSMDCNNLMFAGRCISMDATSLASARVMPQCMSMGMAAGIAAGLSVTLRVEPKQIPIEKLRKMLVERGAILTIEQVNSTPVNEW
jgi:hypothetical protein